MRILFSRCTICGDVLIPEQACGFCSTCLPLRGEIELEPTTRLHEFHPMTTVKVATELTHTPPHGFVWDETLCEYVRKPKGKQYT